MSQATITIAASVTANDETRSLSNSAPVDLYDIITGTQEIGATYEPLAWGYGVPVAFFIYNAGDVDIAVRCELTNYTTNQFVFFTVSPGNIFSVPYMFYSDNNIPTRTASVEAQASSGTCQVDYCMLI